MEAEARRQLEAVRDQMEEDSLDKQVRAQNLPDDVASGVATFLEEEEGGSLGKAGAKNWLMLSGLAKDVIPVDVIGFLKGKKKPIHPFAVEPILIMKGKQEMNEMNAQEKNMIS